LLDLLQAQAQPLAAQGELEPRAVALRVDAVPAGPLGGEQADVLVEADGTRGDVELARELGDREGAGGGAGGGASGGSRHGAGLGGLVDVNVNVADGARGASEAFSSVRRRLPSLAWVAAG